MIPLFSILMMSSILILQMLSMWLFLGIFKALTLKISEVLDKIPTEMNDLPNKMLQHELECFKTHNDNLIALVNKLREKLHKLQNDE